MKGIYCSVGEAEVLMISSRAYRAKPPASTTDEARIAIKTPITLRA